jgi:hypothetical protein
MADLIIGRPLGGEILPRGTFFVIFSGTITYSEPSAASNLS